MKDLMKRWMSFMTFELPIQASYINAKFADIQQKHQLEFPEWSTTATRQQLISCYWLTEVAGHFAFIFGLPALVFFFISGGIHDYTGYFAILLFAGVICYFVLYLFQYRPVYCSTYLPRLENAKEAFERKQTDLLEKCRKAQLPNFSLALVFYVFEKTSGMNSLLCNDRFARLLMKLYGVDPGSLKKNLELIYGKKKSLLPRKQTEISNCFEEAVIFFEEIEFNKGISILKELQKKFI